MPLQKFKLKQYRSFKIEEAHSKLAYCLALVFHAALLMQYQRNKVYDTAKIAPPLILIKDPEEYEVEQVLKHSMV